MCGIIGYVGGRACQGLLLQGLRKLEYRGYDSAGIAWREGDMTRCVRAVGNLDSLEAALARHSEHWSRASTATQTSQPGSATRDGRHTAESPNETPILTRTRAAASGSSSTGSSRITSNCATGWPPTGDAALRHRRRGRRPPDRAELRREPSRRRTPLAGRARRSLRDRGDVRGRAGTLVGVRRECPLVVGLGDGEQFIASSISAFLAQRARWRC